ncbi:winged helix-turn-helix domain-containing protein [Streptomyces sp. NPDC056227]|uniref:winged helix-turn-helix domain-containing protein n=1 Tax=Streptomyces sp. NPDC056227 TaxID=3345753 RepID=UPI0035D9F1D1
MRDEKERTAPARRYSVAGAILPAWTRPAPAFGAHPVPVLTKPFSFVVLLARIRALLRRSSPQRPAVLSAGDLWLDPGSHRCGRGADVLALTPREFGLLEFLLQHPETVVSKHELLTQVWDACFDGDPNIVEVYVGYLRRKIDTPYRRSAIETVRGVGYRLDGKGG